jgi:hypothetical protein
MAEDKKNHGYKAIEKMRAVDVIESELCAYIQSLQK